LFLIYINDLPDICESRPGNTKIFLYIDDAKGIRRRPKKSANTY